MKLTKAVYRGYSNRYWVFHLKRYGRLYLTDFVRLLRNEGFGKGLVNTNFGLE